MPKRAGFHVLVGTDGSPQARAAVAMAAAFPWPASSRGHGVVARQAVHGGAQAEWPATVWKALDASLRRLVGRTRRTLSRRWPDADVIVVERNPVEAILARARSVGAGAIVVGSRGHGMLGRLFLGSVSRGVVRRATCPVLVVKGRPRAVRRLVVGIDGSANARRAVQLVARLLPARGGHATVLAVLEPVRAPSLGLLPGPVRATVNRLAADETARRRREADRATKASAAVLRRAGWRAEARVAEGEPVSELSAAAQRRAADLLVLGARGTGGVERLLLGSVAEGALTRSPVSILIVR